MAHMGCGGNWLKKLTKLKKSNGGGGKRRTKHVSSTKTKSNDIVRGSKTKKSSSTIFANATIDKDGNRWVLGSRIEVVAAIKIQTSFRVFQARKRLRELKGLQRLKKIMQEQKSGSITVQTLSALNHFQTYSKVQDQIQSRRLCMVVQGRLRQKKFQNQLKVGAKLHQVETVWSSTPNSKDELKTRIQIREEAALKRERAMSYAFNHQWRANASQKQLMGNPVLGKVDWGWSWMERWIAARPWEGPLVDNVKTESRGTTPTFKIGKNKNRISSTPTSSNGKISSPKRTFSNGKRVMKSQRRSSSFPPSNKRDVKKDDNGLEEPDKMVKDEEPMTITSK